MDDVKDLDGEVSRRELIRVGATMVVGGALTLGLVGCGGAREYAREAIMPQDEAGDSRMIGSDPRKAVFYEAWYALRESFLRTPNDAGPTGGAKIWDSTCLSNWNYIGSDPNAFTKVQAIPGKVNASVATDPQFATGDAYGKKSGLGRGGQCVYFGCLILYRALNGFMFSTDKSHSNFRWSDLTSRNYPSATEAVAGDLVFKPDGTQHLAVCVGRSGNSLDIVDSNYFGTTGKDEGKQYQVGKLTDKNGKFIAWSSEIIGRHIVDARTYRVITGNAKKHPNLPHRRWYNL
jgi:hypothetical protein